MNKSIEKIVKYFTRFARGDSVRRMVNEYITYRINELINESTFNPPHAEGLKQELLDRNGKKHIFYSGDGKDIPFDDDKSWDGWQKTKYPIFMDGQNIGTLTRVTGPHFDNTVYEGRVVGYVNEGIKRAKERGEETAASIDKVILQHTDGSRIDGHRLKFVA